jgi:RecB family exonuclease
MAIAEAVIVETRSAALESIPVLSPTQVITFIDCSARWHYGHRENLSDPASGLATRGSAVHALVMWYFTGRIAGCEPDEAALRDAWGDIWECAAADAAFGAHEDIEALKASGLAGALVYIRDRAPQITPAICELPVEGEIAGIPVRGFIDILTVDGCVIDLKTKSRKPSGVSKAERLQLATYARLADSASGRVRLDAIVATKEPKALTFGYEVPEEDERYIERIYPAALHGMMSGAYWPNRGSNFCSRKHCAFADRCVEDWGGEV